MSNKDYHRVLASKDGSITFFSDRFQQCYHNPNGAVKESQYVFFEALDLYSRLSQSTSVVIEEVGFGSGLNAWLLLDFLQTSKFKGEVLFRSTEAYPLQYHYETLKLYEPFLSTFKIDEKVETVFNEIQQEGLHRFRFGNCTLEIWSGFFNDRPETGVKNDVIFFDAFSPEKNPDLWTVEVFETLKQRSRPHAILSTYCSATAARAKMVAAGWQVYRKQGVLGKREITLATLEDSPSLSLKKVNQERLLQRYHNGEFNPDFSQRNLTLNKAKFK